MWKIIASLLVLAIAIINYSIYHAITFDTFTIGLYVSLAVWGFGVDDLLKKKK